MDEAYVVEIVPVEGSESGDIVVTELDNLAAPLIRYNTKDMARRVEGACAVRARPFADIARRGPRV